MEAIAVLTIDLPIRVQVPEGRVFSVAGPIGRGRLSFADRPAPPRPDGMYGEGVDDDKGTYVRSTASMQFPVEVGDPIPPSDEAKQRLDDEVRTKAWDSMKTFLRSYAHFARHLEALLVLKPESYTLDIIDPTTERGIKGFPKVSAHVLPGGMGLKRTLTNLGNLDLVLEGNATIPLPDQLLLRAEAEAALLDDLDHALLDVASALEIFIDQLIDEDIVHALDPASVRKQKGIYDKYDKALRALGRLSLKDSHPSPPPKDQALNFEMLEFIFAVRNNIIHKGVRQFTLAGLGGRYKSPYVARHARHEGMMVDRPADVIGLVRGASSIIQWVRSNTPRH